MDDSQTARIVNGISDLISLALEVGGGIIPETGTYNSVIWGRLFGVSDETIRDWVKLYGIPHMTPGRSVLIRAEDFLKHLPRSQ